MNDTNNLFLNYFGHNEHLSSSQRFYYKFLKNHLSTMESYSNTVSIIIQGPLNNRSINTIDNYLKYGEVIVSCWNNNDISQLDKYKDKIKIVVNNYNDIKDLQVKTNLKNPNIFQNHTTLNGLKKASGFFSIKLRSDESYPSLDNLISRLKSIRDSKDDRGVYNDHKILTSNIYFRFDKQAKFHPSDHIIAGQTKRMINIFKRSTFLSHQKNIKLSPEQIICKAAIETYYDPINKKNDCLDNARSIELMKKHFDIIRINSLPNCIWTSSYRKYDPLRAEEVWCHGINELDK